MHPLLRILGVLMTRAISCEQRIEGGKVGKRDLVRMVCSLFVHRQDHPCLPYCLLEGKWLTSKI